MLPSPILELLKPHRFPGAWGRPLSSPEAALLAGQANRFQPGTEVLAGEGFDPLKIHGNRFSGRVVLGGEIYDSVLEDSVVGEGALVDRCPLVRRTVVCPGALVRNSTLDCTEPTGYGVGTVVKGGLETPGREIRIWDSMTLDDGVRYLSDPDLKKEVEERFYAAVFDRTVVGAGVKVINCPWVDRAVFSPGTTVIGAAWVEVCATLSTPDEPVLLGSGVQVRESILQWGVSVDSAAQVSRSILLEHSGAGRQALVTESLVGPNTEVGGGEVTASFLGPFIGFHHQSLLIAAWWPEGRGNVGYGANIGSNHTSRAPDQELWAGEGTFFGLATAVKFPSNFHDAPYSILASGIVTLPQRVGLPFSLLVDEPLDGPGTRGLNRIIPGWVLRENVYLLLRNESKYLQRNKARRHSFDLRIFRPEIVDKLWKARVQLGNIGGKAVYNKEDLPSVGKNYLLEEDRKAALDVYREFLRYGALKLFADEVLDGIPCDADWLRSLFRRLNLDYFSTEGNLQLYLAEARRLWNDSLAAKERDDKRGSLIIPDYQTFHRPAEEDGFLLKKQAELGILDEKIRKFGGVGTLTTPETRG